MQIYMRVCPICAKENIRQTGHSKTYVPGWIFWFKGEDYITEDTTCSKHHEQKLVKKSMTCEEFKVLNKISNEPSFMESMNDLKEKDPVEFQLKLAQFKATTVQQESATQQQNVPKCPTCGSTNIKKISAGSRWLSTGLFGISSGKMGKSMECRNCGYKW